MEAGRGPGGRAATRRRRDDCSGGLIMERLVSASVNPRRVFLLNCGILFWTKGLSSSDLGLVVGLSETGCPC
jgi:hypothetical protein